MNKEDIEYIDVKDLNNFERTELISIRSIELQKGSKPLIEIGDITDPNVIATMELDMGVIPYIIKRIYPNGKIKEFKIISKNKWK